MAERKMDAGVSFFEELQGRKEGVNGMTTQISRQIQKSRTWKPESYVFAQLFTPAVPLPAVECSTVMS